MGFVLLWGLLEPEVFYTPRANAAPFLLGGNSLEEFWGDLGGEAPALYLEILANLLCHAVVFLIAKWAKVGLNWVWLERVHGFSLGVGMR
jgi:hypothetical protein